MARLRRKGWRKAGQTTLIGLAVLVALSAAGYAVLDRAVREADPLAEAGRISHSRMVVDREGHLLRAFQTADDRWRLPLAVDEVDPLFFRMLLAYEDRRFDSHSGVDPRALLRASLQAAKAGGIVSGGSTLTMQVARLLKERPTRSFGAKAGQIVDALALERRLSKQEVLGLYLMRAPYGGNIEGLRAATLAWFGKEPGRLTPAEAALLVALPQAPEARRPDRFPQVATRARDRVLDRMALAGVLSREEAEAAKRDGVPKYRRDVPILAPHSARQALLNDPAADVIRLTLQASLQSALEGLAHDHAARLGGKVSAAILVADHASGEILAHVGSAGLLEEARQGHVDMSEAVRSPGSALKPLIYGLAFEDGIAHPESLIDDRPSTIAGYSPVNFDRSFQGTVTVREALQLSLNVPAVKLLDAVGAPKFMSRLRAAGVRPRLSEAARPGLAIGLGGLGVSLRELVRLYAGLARGGEPVALREIAEDPAADTADRRIMQAHAAWYVGDILSGTPAPHHAIGTGIAYKTGTSYGYRDAWAVGFDGRHVIGVWLGRADGTPVPGISGFDSAAPLLFEAFQRIGPQRVPLSNPPAGVLEGASASLPPPLRLARVAGSPAPGNAGDGLEIAYPPQGALVELGLGQGAGSVPLVVKIRRGKPPFVWFANGVPVENGTLRRSLAWLPDGPGASTISVVDADGEAASVSVTLR
ncbi:penicillin-binding protein 1C [Stappia sp. F7233]|uniref:peptidoglycan glycosyltransferase n=1 Tax=Stappia albiluteola TaxID=2758565 RepID=A0A839AHT0_9HYPH|nr:penicillin-binding protein 1C [Stappia albiluteola]MBA5778069.1 penicillin-binding protein 1C [Stappia albiluteola]